MSASMPGRRAIMSRHPMCAVFRALQARQSLSLSQPLARPGTSQRPPIPPSSQTETAADTMHLHRVHWFAGRHRHATMDRRGFDLAIADRQGANRLTLYVLAAAPEHERQIIGGRTKHSRPRGRNFRARDLNPRPTDRAVVKDIGGWPIRQQRDRRIRRPRFRKGPFQPGPAERWRSQRRRSQPSC